MPFREFMRGIEWNGSHFVAVGERGLIFRSANGTDWHWANSITTEDLHRIAWIDGQWFATGFLGVILTSPDGLDWTERRIGAGIAQRVSGIAANDTGRIVAVGDVNQAGQVLISDDGGATWAEQPFSGPRLYDVVWTGSAFFAVGSQGGNAGSQWSGIWYSIDGKDWEERYTSLARLHSLAWTGTRLVSVGSRFEPPGSQRVISVFIYSDDGISWHVSLEDTPGHLPDAVRWLGDACYAVGTSGFVARSPDGISWSMIPAEPRLDPSAGSTRAWLDDVAGPAGNRIAVGYGSLYRESETGHWQNLVKGPAETFAAASDGDEMVIASITDHNRLEGSSESKGRIYHSSDGGRTLELVFEDSQMRAGDVIYHEGIFLVPAANGVALRSTDGRLWQTELTGGLHQPYAIAAHEGSFVTAGASGEILYRNAAGSWSVPVRTGSGTFTAVTRGQDRWIVVGSETRTSTDGINWQLEDTKTSRTLRGVAAIGDIAVAAGDSGTVTVRDANGQWKLGPSFGFNWLHSVAAYDDRFYIVNGYGRIWSSLDGFDWIEEERIPTARFRRLKAVGNQLVASNYFGNLVVSQMPPAREGTILPFSAWLAAHPEEFPEGSRGARDTLGPFALPNLLAYGYGVLPSAATESDLPKVHSEDGRILLDYKRNRNATGVSYTIMSSRDLTTWTVVPPHHHWRKHIDATHEAWRARFESDGLSKGFLRIEVSLPESPSEPASDQP